ncbi:G-protein coupled receptor moody [Anabrus simplex]|uniref:G-protein coupled receptor moody n=1 Tax=Anabrus simplex TaxID=316456 RepID=UPI0035A2741F
MFCCFNLPLAASMFWQRAWTHGHLLCQLFPLMRYGLLAVSLFTVLAITINRYVMIGHPRLYPKLYRKQYLGLMVACTWLFGFGALVATWFGKWGRFGLDDQIGSCSILPDQHNRSPKEFLFIVAFVIPCLAIVVCYARIFYIVRKTALKSRVATRSNTVTTSSNVHNTTTASSSGVTGSSGIMAKRAYHEPSSNSGRRGSNFLNRKCNFSTTGEDSAVGSTSTAATITAEKTSMMENGHTTTSYNNNKSSEVRIQIPEGAMYDKGSNLAIPNPHLLSPPSPTQYRQNKVIGEASSSSGVDAGLPEDEYNDDEERHSTRSGTPTSFCSSTYDPSHAGTDKAANGKTKRHRPHQRERLSSAVAFNSALSHVASVFRRGSRMKCESSPRRQSTATTASMAVPGKMTAKDKKLLKMILVIFASFLVCYLPITISKTFRDAIDVHGLNVAGYILIYLSTCINPIIYVVMSSEYRQAYKNLLMCRGYGPEGQGHGGGAGSGGGLGRNKSQRA